MGKAASSIYPPAAGLAPRVPKPRTQLGMVLAELRKNRGAVVGGLILLGLCLAALAAPILAPYDPIRQGMGPPPQGPGPQHPMGTDQFGRDVYSRVLFGAQISLRIGFISVGIAGLFGVLLGLIAGYYEGLVGGLVVGLMDLMLAFPGILLALAIVAALGPSLTNAMIAVGVSAIPTYTRILRGTVLSAKHNVYVDAARVIGCPDVRLLIRHILPNVVSPVIVLATLGIGTAILTGSALTFLGLGAQPPTPEWGAVLAGGRSYLRTAPWITTFPGVAIMLTVIAINFLGDGLRDALEPRLRI